MDITILNGNPDPRQYSLDNTLEILESDLMSTGDRVKILNLRDLNIQYCTGCWSCWWGPTPGECVFKDESALVCSATINSDLVILASPVVMGFTSALLKKAQDKLIPLLHPYLKLVNSECHHRKRYERYPLLGLILERDNDADDEDIRIVNMMFRRFSLNFRTRVAFSFEAGQCPGEVIDAITHI